ncbi:MAG: molybdopterin oxidoreductase family protein [Aggregatilineales bacterium]
MNAQLSTHETDNAKRGERTGKAICPYCGVGCLMDVTTQNNRIVELHGSPESPVNRGKLCPKGALLSPVLDLPGRLLRPQFHTNRNAEWIDLDWDTALTNISARLHEIIDRYGPDSVALYGSGQLDTESWYLGNKLFKGYIGSNHVDSNSRLCMASAVAAYQTTLGSDGPPTCYDDIFHSDCYLIAGSNMADAHPVTFQQMKAHRHAHPNVKMIVLDPRCTHTAQAADIHVPLVPGSDVAFFNAVARIALDRGLHHCHFIENYTVNFEAYAALLYSLDLHELAAICGIPLSLMMEVADVILRSRALLSFYCMGLGQSSSGTAKNQALIDLHLLLGQIGKPGAGPFSLTGQPNAMGGRELGGLAHLLPGYRLIENADHRREVEQAWHISAGSIAPKSGLTAVEMFQALDSGRLKAIWIVCNNPLVSLPNLNMAKRALQMAELVIVQDCFETETTRIADFTLPAAQWIERSGTMTNSERRVTRSTKLAEAPGEAKPDWWIFSRVAQAMGYAGFDFTNNEAIWDEYRALTRNRPCDQFGITNERLKAEQIQWPCPSADHPGTARRYTDYQFATADGRARFVACRHEPPKEQPTLAFPLTLTSGRMAAQWHTMTRTGKIPRLAKQATFPYIELYPTDALAYAIADGDSVTVESVRGCVTVKAKLNDGLRPGVVFMPFHWGDAFAPGVAANELTNDILDPVSKEPEYKACAVQIAKAG